MLRFSGVLMGLMVMVCVPCFGQEDGQVYRIKSRLTDKVLARNEDGTLLVQHSERPRNKRQQWKLVKHGEFFHIVNVASGKALTVPSNNAREQIELQDNGDDGKPRKGQLWSFELLKSRYWIQSRRNNLYLDVYNFEKGEGVKIIQQTRNENKADAGNQIWELIPVE